MQERSDRLLTVGICRLLLTAFATAAMRMMTATAATLAEPRLAALVAGGAGGRRPITGMPPIASMTPIAGMTIVGVRSMLRCAPPLRDRDCLADQLLDRP